MHVFRNTANKVQFIDFLTSALKRVKISFIQSDGNTDVMIVTETIKMAAENVITVFSDDTDVLVLLMYHCGTFTCDIYFSAERVVKKKKMTKAMEYWIGSKLSLSIWPYLICTCLEWMWHNIDNLS